MIDITDEKTNGIIYETFDTPRPASLFFAKTPVHSAEHKGSYRILTDAMQYHENCESLVPQKFSSVRYICVHMHVSGFLCVNMHMVSHLLVINRPKSMELKTLLIPGDRHTEAKKC